MKTAVVIPIFNQEKYLRHRGLLRFPWGGRFPLVREWFKLRLLARAGTK